MMKISGKVKKKNQQHYNQLPKQMTNITFFKLKNL